jgi:hypothetical protein
MNFMNPEPQTSNLERRTRGPWVVRCVFGLLATGTVLAASSGAQQTNGTSTNATNSTVASDSYPTLNSFNIIQQNNIFDPFRRHITTGGPRVAKPAVDAFALTGTMSYSKGRFAFFNGTSSQYSKVLEVGGSIAGYTVKEITPTNVTLTAKDKDFQMPVGQQLRNERGTWRMSGQTIEQLIASQTNGDETEPTAAESTAPPAGANAQMSDVLKRLMQAREQELK